VPCEETELNVKSTAAATSGKSSVAYQRRASWARVRQTTTITTSGTPWGAAKRIVFTAISSAEPPRWTQYQIVLASPRTLANTANRTVSRSDEVERTATSNGMRANQIVGHQGWTLCARLREIPVAEAHSNRTPGRESIMTNPNRACSQWS